MNFSELENTEKVFCDIEENPELAKLRIRGDLLWPILRPSLYFALNQHYFSNLSSSDLFKDNKFLFIKRQINKTINHTNNYHHLNKSIKLLCEDRIKQVCLIMSIGSFRYKTNNGNYEHPVWSHLIKKITNFKPLLLETNFQKHLVSDNFSIYSSADNLNIPSASQFIKYLFSKDSELQVLFELLKDKFQQYKLLDLWVDFVKNGTAQRKILLYKTQQQKALEFLKKIKPAKVILRGMIWYGLISAAKRLNIPVIEIQHGETTRYDPLYHWPEWSFPLEFELPSPNHVITFGEYWNKEIRQGSPLPNTIFHPFGSIPLDMFRKSQDIQKTLPFNGINLLYTTGIPFESEFLFWENFLQQIEKIDFEFHLNIKCHPQSSLKQISIYTNIQRKYPQLVTVYKHSETSVLRLLAESQIHISCGSTCHYESIAMGIPTIVLKFSRWILVEDLIKMKVARECNNSESLLYLVLAAKMKNSFWYVWLEATKNNKYSFFEKGALEKITHFIDNVNIAML